MVALGPVLHNLAVSAAACGYWGTYVEHRDPSNVHIPSSDAQIVVLGQPNSSYPTAVGMALGVGDYTRSQNNTFT